MLAGALEYAALAIVYSLLAAALVETLLRLWRVRDPTLAVRFRLVILALPPVAPPLFLLLNPARGSESFRGQTALLDLRNWLGPEPSLSHAGWVLLLAGMVCTAALLAGQELRLLRQILGPRFTARPLPHPPERLPGVPAAASGRSRAPEILLVDQPDPLACTAGLLRPTILVTTGLVEMLDAEELEGVLAHEAAHVRRRDNWTGWLIFGLRLASFYNPVALFTFHQISHSTERLCDAEAAAATGKPLALASALIKVYESSRAPALAGPGLSRRLAGRAAVLENRARRALVEDRAARLVHPERVHSVSHPELRLALLVAAVAGVCYLVV